MSKKRIEKPKIPPAGTEPVTSVLPTGYAELLVELKTSVRSAQLKAAVAVNSEMIKLYWDIGRAIVERQEIAKWGSKVIEQIGEDLQREFPGVTGFSSQNVSKMRTFFLAYTNQKPIHSQPVSELAFGWCRPRRRFAFSRRSLKKTRLRRGTLVASLPRFVR